jgi:outer membrane protein TolC
MRLSSGRATAAIAPQAGVPAAGTVSQVYINPDLRNQMRQRLEEAFAQQELAAKKWLPDLSVGTAYYRHEGGIQDFNGQLIRSILNKSFDFFKYTLRNRIATPCNEFFLGH